VISETEWHTILTETFGVRNFRTLLYVSLDSHNLSTNRSHSGYEHMFVLLLLWDSDALFLYAVTSECSVLSDVTQEVGKSYRWCRRNTHV